jgi:hypothetical protein
VLDDTDYVALIQASNYTGTPAINSFRVVRQTRTTAHVVIEFADVPGPGNSVTFDVMIFQHG